MGGGRRLTESLAEKCGYQNYSIASKLQWRSLHQGVSERTLVSVEHKSAL